jgi:hypothetical protein
MSLVTQLQRRPLNSRALPQRWRPARRRRARSKTPRWLVVVLLGTVAVSVAAVTAWVIAGGGDLSGLPAPVAEWLPRSTLTDAGTAGSAPVDVESTPSGAEVRIDGIRRGQTPIVVGVAPGTHELTLRHPEAMESVRSIDVPADGTALVISLWRRRAEVLPIRPVYPGASLVDARFVADGTVALTVSLPIPSGAAQPPAARDCGNSIRSRPAWVAWRSRIRRQHRLPWSHSLQTDNRWPTLCRVPQGPRRASGPLLLAPRLARQRVGRRQCG